MKKELADALNKDVVFGRKHERYVEVCKQMELLGIVDVSTQRQKNNDTRVWRLPIKCGVDRFIEVASFKTGYVRNQNGGYTNYQLNKRCENEPEYYPEHKYIDGEHKKTGKYLKYTTRGCVLIPNEIDRLEYLISYCLKNYYIKRANEVADGKYVSKWYHEYEVERAFMAKKVAVIEDLQEKLEKANSTYSENTGAMARIKDLEVEVDIYRTKLQSIIRTARH